MQAPFEATEGRTRLAAIISSFPADSPHWNEAQNRFQFVDRLLTECLGWERPYIEVENSDELGGKADYVLGNNPPKAVLEAKREAKIFNALLANQAWLEKLRRFSRRVKTLRRPYIKSFRIAYFAVHRSQSFVTAPNLSSFKRW